jgi:hypothetical protein
VSVENFAMMEINEKIAVAVVQAAVVEVHVAAVHLVVWFLWWRKLNDR